ncbi:MAG: hypothetical protein RMI94_05420 [Bryobacterales bacterium]|nr:hypothetical protein [Bryobacteraceae bacterium]MDW8129969.1 hypothetical protein [Bryobacterales bacterium]
MARSSTSLMVNLFDGARQPLSGPQRVLVRVINGAGRILSARYHRGPSVFFADVPCHGDFRDNYRVVVSAPRSLTSGITGLALSPGRLATVDFMVLPREGSFHFREATWDRLVRSRPHWARLLEREPYQELLEGQPAALAGMLNLLAALEQTPLNGGAAIHYLEEVAWRPAPEPDRIFAWARRDLLTEVARGVQTGLFHPELLPGAFHPGATASFKETRLPAANLQITFHETRREARRGEECVLIELDMDYYPEPCAHALLEVVPNMLFGHKTDPRAVYMMRWMAARRLGLPEFDPLYTVI